MAEERRTTCRSVIERLPWLLNGSLDPDEQQPIEEHLRTCARCHRALEATRILGDAAAAHLPIDLLLDHAEDRAMRPADRALVESHLDDCSQCRAELMALTMPLQPPKVHQAVDAGATNGGIWRPLAIAAAFAAIALGLAWWSTLSVMRDEALGLTVAEPTVSVITVEVLPRDATRGEGTRSAAVADLESGSRFVALVLLPTLVAATGFDLTVTGPEDSAPRWRFDAVHADETGAVTLLLPTASLVPGDYELRLSMVGAGSEGPSEHFTIRFETASTADSTTRR